MCVQTELKEYIWQGLPKEDPTADKALLDWLNQQAVVVYCNSGRQVVIDHDEDTRAALRRAMSREARP